MNRHLHRVVFNAARGMRMVVQETASSTGKGASKATKLVVAGTLAGSAALAPMLLGAALAGILASAPVHAQIVGAPNVSPSLRPTVLVAPNGVPLINIATPSAAGVSRNVYNQFNVAPNGAILNNSRSNVQTQLGGYVQGNPFLATGPARIILNEVNGGSPSQLRGYIEVGGQRAEVVIANPAGISVDGGGFINASRATLTTGTPQFSPSGSLDSFLVRGGTVTIDGAGLDARTTDYAAILARAVQTNAGIWASELKVVTGANQISADHTQITPTAGTGAAPTFALDVAALGGMYSGKIVLVGTEAGLGMRNAGAIQSAPSSPAMAGAGQLVVTSAGRLENIGTIQATADANIAASGVANSGRISSGGNLKIATQDTLANSANGTGGVLEAARLELSSAAGNIDNRNGGTLRQSSSAALSISAATVSNTAAGVIGPEPVSDTPAQPSGGTNPGTPGNSGTGTTTASGAPATTGSTGPGATITPAPYVPPSPGSITAAGAVLNGGSHIFASGPITLQTANLVNNGGTLSVASMTLNQPSFQNVGGKLNVSGAFTANLGTFNNSTGTLRAGSLDITTTGDLNNQDGVLTSDANANLTVGGFANNTRGKISATGALTTNVVGAIQNTSGTLVSNQNLSVSGQSLDNSQGHVQSASGNVQATIDQQLLNTNGQIAGGANVTIQTGSLDGTKGTLQSTGDLNVTAAQGLTATGTNVAGGKATLQGASVDISGSQTAGTNIGLEATQGNVTTSGATVVAPGTFAITANAQPGQTLVNNAGTLNAGQQQINASNIANTNGGQIVQTGVGATTLVASGSIDNSGGRIASNSQDLSLQATSIVNTAGKIEHAGTGTLNIAGGSYSGANGTITGNGALAVNVTGAFNQDGGTTTAQQITVDTGSLSNRGGQIIQSGTGATRIAATGAIDSSSGLIATNGQNLTLKAASITSASGKIEHAGTGTLNIAGGSYSGANGEITSNGALVGNVTGAFNQDGGKTSAQQITLAAGALSNQGGSIVQVGTGATTLTVGGVLNDNQGVIASNGTITVTAGSMTNQGGKLQAAGTSDLNLAVTNQLDNSAAGKILAGGNVTVAAGSLNDNAGSITAVGNLNATVSGAVTNQGGTLAANGNTILAAASLDNSGGTTAAVTGDLTVTTSGATTNNAGTLQAGGITTLSNGGLSNLGGKVFGNALAIEAHGNAVNNSAKGTLAATTTVDLKSGALQNDTGLVQSGGAMTINTNGQGLTNTNAAGYSNGQGGITSAGTLTLKTGATNNNAGFIGAKGDLNASTGQLTNANGGTVLGQANVAINTNGATYDNRGGQTLAAGDLTINAGGGTIDNTSSLLRSSGTTTLNAAAVTNATTTGTNQGIEGTHVAINTGTLGSQTGAVRAAQNLTVTSGGTIDNSAGGLLSAGDTLKVIDPNAANPSTKTLNVINTNGTLVGTKSVQLDAATFSGDGQLVSGKDLSVALTQDIVNNADVIANGNLSYGTTGHLTNNGKLIAGNTLTVSGNLVDNTANAEMSGTNTTLNLGTLNNRGLIDSADRTRINAGAVNNVGTGRIYGNQIAIATGSLTNDTETANGTTKAGTIASRGNLDIGASTITNREHALIFSSENMAIGGSLDASGKATGQGGTLNNLSATIESLGNMSISMGQTNNWDTHVQLGPQTTTTKQAISVAPVGGGGFYTMDQVIVVPGQPFVWARNPDGGKGALLYSNGYGIWNTTFTTTADTAINADPATISSGGDMTLVGAVSNRDSRIIAGGTLTASNVTNTALQGSYSTSSVAVVTSDTGQIQPLVIGPSSSGMMDVGAYQKVDHVNATNNYNSGAAATGATNASGGGASGASGGSRTGTIVEVAANVGGVAGTGGTGASGANGTTAGAAGNASGATGQTIPMVVRTSTPSLAVPQASLFSTRPDPSSHFLIETDPRFANYRNWLSSDYLLNSLGLDPNNILKRLGDGFYEQKLIREQVAQLTGYRYLDGFNDDGQQYAALMNSGATFAKQYGLTPGIALSATQMAQLTSDIVWLVEQTVTLPNGTTQRVLVPQLYVRVRPGDIDGSGAILSADATVIKSSGDLVNTGTIAGRSLVKIDAENVNNLAGGRIAGGSVGINARNDINNIGASITADDAAILTAGRDINVRTTTASGAAGNRNIDRVAGVYVSNPAGVLIASAGRDVNLIGAALISGGAVSVGAARNVNLSTVTESSTASALGQNIAGIASQSRDVGSIIQGQEDVRLAAGNDLNIRASAVQSLNGALVATAKNDINVTSGVATSNVATATVHSSSTLFTKKSSSAFDSSNTTDVLSSSLSGKSMALVAGNDINLQAAQLRSDNAMSLAAGHDINLTTANKTDQELHASQTKSSATGLGNAIGMSMGPDQPTGAAMMGAKSGTQASASFTTEAVGTSISAGSLQTVSGRDTTLQGATVVADNDITMIAGRNLTIESAQNTSVSSSYNGSSKSGMVGTWYNPAVGNIKGSQANATATTTQQASQVASLSGNVSMVAGDTYRQTASSVMASGQAGPLAGGDVNILAKNVVINAADNTSLSVTLDKSSSSILGGSANFAGVSTNNVQGAVNTVRAMGDTGGDGRMQALGALNLAMSGKQAYNAAQAIGGSGQLSYGVSVNVSRNTSQSTSFTSSTEAVGSGIVGANNVNIVATGGGKGSNIDVVGSTIAAGNTVNMAADNNVTLEASANTSVTTGQNSSHGSNVGVTFGGGAQNGFSIQLGVSNGKGSNNQNDVSYNATQVSGGKAVNISSGGDLTLKGATVQADRVAADVGGNLNIESLQDVSVGKSRQSSSGFNVSLCIPPICYGIVATASASAAGAKADGVFVSPAVQSGIKAGDGGFNVKVAGNTDLKGAVIESTQAAIDAGKNSFATGGTLTMSDLKNVSQSSGDSYSVSGGIGIGYTTAPTAGTATTPAQGMGAAWSGPNNVPSGSAGVGSYSGSNQSSVTKSGISGIAGDQSVRTGDNSSAGTLVKDWNTKEIIKNVQAQSYLTEQFNGSAAKAVGEFANGETRKYEDASRLADAAERVLGDPNLTPEQRRQAEDARDDAFRVMAREQTTYDQWKEGGLGRVAAHMIVGALGGGANGALGASSAALAAPLIDEFTASLPDGVKNAVGAAIAAGIGAAAGGRAGAVAGYSEDANNRQLAQAERDWLAANRMRVANEARARAPGAFALLSDEQIAGLVDKFALLNLDDATTQMLVQQYGKTAIAAMGAIRVSLLSDTQGMVITDKNGITLQMFTNTAVTRGGLTPQPNYYYDSSMYSESLPTTASAIAEFVSRYGYPPPLNKNQIAALDDDAKSALGVAAGNQLLASSGNIAITILNIVEIFGGSGIGKGLNLNGVPIGRGEPAVAPIDPVKIINESLGKTPSILGADVPPAGTTLNQGARIALYYKSLEGAPAATNAKEAFNLIANTLNAVENAYSGVPAEANPGLAYKGRMYPPRPDYTTTNPDGSLTATTKGNKIDMAVDGTITIYKLNADRTVGPVVLVKPGAK
ncbi:hemagglutinin repeat-containing protein [Variovorax sp. PAMC26660]|uniref:hemagglutinin repeat-containing protein n=1 Tax=Variovorax sp. PAMC26660 TaxID=2762322 RepID=UPI00164E3D65|nr:hemagglutinin repeat-containing protein [Variovorax sp. PAMC26660]QNK67635.1 hemagglutinin repeat-containing protein [Variovorax sp. PAMC26660]